MKTARSVMQTDPFNLTSKAPKCAVSRAGAIGRYQCVRPWQTRPLCCRYLLLLCKTLVVSTRGECVPPYRILRWALGLLADGQMELCGVWHESSSAPSEWSDVFNDLHVRGVKTTRFVDGLEGMAISRAMRGACADAVALSSIESSAAVARAESIPRHVHNLTPRDRRIIRRAEDAAHRLDQRLCRALDGRTCFNDGEAAVSFVAETLMRAESDLGSLAASSGKRIGRRGSKGSVRSSTSVAGH